jgi:hypothetical protein
MSFMAPGAKRVILAALVGNQVLLLHGQRRARA